MTLTARGSGAGVQREDIPNETIDIPLTKYMNMIQSYSCIRICHCVSLWVSEQTTCLSMTPSANEFRDILLSETII